MNCDWVKPNITLYVFEELGDADRAEVETHLGRCRDCAREAEAEKELRRLMDLRTKLDPTASLLAQCRISLAEAIEEMPVPSKSFAGASNWTQWLSAPFAGLRVQWQAGMAVALLSVGFMSGTFLASRRANGDASINAANIAGVRSISSRPDGSLDIALDTTTEHKINGSLDDPRIRQVLLSALADYNTGVRLDSIEQLKKAVDSGKDASLINDPQIRAGLIASLRSDRNPGVRLAAIGALKGWESDPEVRKTLLSVLVSDTNAGVRIKAIEMLSAQRDTAAIGALQRLAQGDSNSYIRMKSADTLRKWDAPVDIY